MYSKHDIKETIAGSLRNVYQLQSDYGLFSTFRIDYSLSDQKCHIDETVGKCIDTKFDHAFILSILMELRDHFAWEEEFLPLLKRGVQLSINDKIVVENSTCKTIQWRHYNIPHNGSLILPDLDNVAKNLILIEQCLQSFGPVFFIGIADDLELLSNKANYLQFRSLLRPVGNASAFVTYFGNKSNNDIDPICNLSAVQSALLFLNGHEENLDEFRFIQDVISYLITLGSNFHEIKAEYYEPISVYYNYAKLLNLCENLRPSVREFAEMPKSLYDGLTDAIVDYIAEGKIRNVLDMAFALSSLLRLGYDDEEIDKGVSMILRNRRHDNSWDAYEFYKQRHPHRIFGSRGLTTAACLEALKLKMDKTWKNPLHYQRTPTVGNILSQQKIDA